MTKAQAIRILEGHSSDWRHSGEWLERLEIGNRMLADGCMVPCDDWVAVPPTLKGLLLQLGY